jgi:hypothetical protein
MGLWQDGWNMFVTQERDFNDGQQDCDAEIQATNRTTDTTITYYGTTANLRGHAEIDGLYQFLKSINWDVNAFQNYVVTVTCLAKPCCKYCSAVLGLCNIYATEGTYKVNKAMGVSYALPPDVRAFLRRLYNTSDEKILSELCA